MSIQKELRQSRDIPRSFAKRRESQTHDVESKIEIFAELACSHSLPKILVRGRNDANVTETVLEPPTR